MQVRDELERPEKGIWQVGVLQYWDRYVRRKGEWYFERQKFHRSYTVDALERPRQGRGPRPRSPDDEPAFGGPSELGGVLEANGKRAALVPRRDSTRVSGKRDGVSQCRAAPEPRSVGTHDAEASLRVKCAEPTSACNPIVFRCKIPGAESSG